MNTKWSVVHKLFISLAVVAVVASIPHQYIDASENNATIRHGHVGSSVRALQKSLKKAGYYPYAIDGIYGNQTEAAVRTFQLHTGISVDGIAGNKTLEALSEFIANETIPVQVLKDGHLLDGTFIRQALHLIGSPYKWGGATPNGFDCSGFIKYVFSKKGIHIPRTIQEIWNSSFEVEKPSIGDLVFFETYKPGPSHAGIYIGDGRFIHSGTSKGVTISKLSQSYWSERYLGSKRIAQYK
ncbi:MAG TPA: hypothetical protein GX497_09700 [Bacillus bacterium]|nr:hypothetical protein [Bacillus sp. (in: firmicutes)]